MNILYSFGLFIYQFTIRLASLFNKKAKQFTEGRKNWKSGLPSINANEEWIWFQASSQGEFEDGVSLIKTIRKQRPNLKILLTFFSPSGYENKKNHEFADHTMYLPMDYRSNAQYLLSYFNFKAIFFVRHDIWKNYLHIAKEMKIPSYLIFCTLTSTSSTLKGISRSTFRKAFHSFDHIFCHDEVSQKILKEYFGVTKTTVSGSTRVENIAAKNVIDDILIEEFTKGHKSIIIGSSALEDEKMLLPVIEKFKIENIKWVIVPHEIDRDFSHLKTAQLYSSGLTGDSDILIVNAIGLLSSIYKYCDIAIVGGGFSKMGIHNIIEPAIFGLPVLFGPNDRDYPEARTLIEEGQAFKYKDASELIKLITQLLESNKSFESNYIKDNKQVSTNILHLLETGFNF